MVIEAMDTSSPIEESFIETLEVSSTSSSSIHVGWQIRGSSFPFIEGYRVHYQKVNSKYVQYGPELDRTDNEYEIRNLVADTYYKVCLVVYRNFTSDFRECVDASTTNWQLPVSIGSSIGAVLALSMIVLIVLLSRCQIPVQYRRKKRHNSSRYDTMSSNYHDEHYDFSETVTHGNDEDFVSECDHDDEGLCDISSNDATRPKHTDKVMIPNGLCKNHVHPHMHHHQHQQHRNSLGRIHCSGGHGHHHPRPTRAYSISSDAHAFSHFSQHYKKDLHKLPRYKESHELDETFLVKDACRKDYHKLSRAKESHELEDTFLVKDVERQKRAQRFHREHSLTSGDMLKQETETKQRPPLVSQQSSQGFSYIDEMPDISPTSPPPATSVTTATTTTTSTSMSSTTATSTKQKQCYDETSSTQSTINTDRVFMDSIKFDDLSAFGAVGGIKETFIGQAPVRHWGSTKPVEMSHKNANLAHGDSSSFDEHAL